MGDIHVKENKKDCCSIYMYRYIYIYINLPMSAIVRLPHPRSGEKPGPGNVQTSIPPYQL